MTKESIKLSIDSDLLEKAKKQIPNISRFVEECLKNYLGEGIGLVETSKMNDLVMTISKSQLELYLMNEKGNIEKAKEKAAKDEINLSWRRLYTEYRDTKTINQDKLTHASKTLKVDTEELIDIVEVCYAYNRRDNIDTTEWSEVYEAYGYGEGE